jgi:SAM-dependent methyltransferase
MLKNIPWVVRAYRQAMKILKFTSSRIEFLEFKRDFARFRDLSEKVDSRFNIRWSERNPRLTEKTATHSYDRHYIYHTAWAARVLIETKPKVHVDISSHLYFVALVSAFIPFKFYDYRPADLRLNNLSSEAADLLALPFADKSIESLSCLSVVEHVGLGRYGDPIDPIGDIKACSELSRVLAVGGSLLYAVPVGRPRIEFNAHRIYSYDQVLTCFPQLVLKEFTLIPDRPEDGHLMRNATKEMSDVQHFGCGCFWFQRLK